MTSQEPQNQASIPEYEQVLQWQRHMQAQKQPETSRRRHKFLPT